MKNNSEVNIEDVFVPKMNYKRASSFTGLSERTLRTYVSMKRIPYLKIGRRVVFDPLALKVWLESKAVPTLAESLSGKGGNA